MTSGYTIFLELTKLVKVTGIMSNDDLATEYQFDYQRAKPNRFADQNNDRKRTIVVLDEDVSQVFKTPEAVNKALRALIEAMPH
ncbi:hypothetical protein LEP3755_11620 [Leptolyngbya sp. NIES-3755]|nr:hypothetical protein LEP3755_11620 [Leptolyngbya sp. NIES-3755]